MKHIVYPVLHPWSPSSVGLGWAAFGGGSIAGVSTAWGTSNLGVYIPFRLLAPIVITKAVVHNGSTVAGNIDIGIYDYVGRRIISTGSTAQSGVSSLQQIVVDAQLGPGVFYMALALSDSTGTVQMGSGVGSPSAGKALGLYQQTSAFPLPAMATFETYTLATLPLFGFLLAPRTVI